MCVKKLRSRKKLRIRKTKLKKRTIPTIVTATATTRTRLIPSNATVVVVRGRATGTRLSGTRAVSVTVVAAAGRITAAARVVVRGVFVCFFVFFERFFCKLFFCGF